MTSRTEPLGPRDSAYPVADYELVIPDLEDVAEDIRIERLSLHLVKDQTLLESSKTTPTPLLWDAAIIFACGGDSWPMRLKYDVDFVAAYPCHAGPHVLFYDYAYQAVKVDGGLVDIHDWGPCARSATPRDGNPDSRPSSAKTAPGPSSSALSNVNEPASAHLDKVLVIEALGVSDNEVFARAWCAHHGVSAVVANVRDTCMACAVREAYACCLSVVILTEGGRKGEEDVGVNG